MLRRLTVSLIATLGLALPAQAQVDVRFEVQSLEAAPLGPDLLPLPLDPNVLEAGDRHTEIEALRAQLEDRDLTPATVMDLTLALAQQLDAHGRWLEHQFYRCQEEAVFAQIAEATAILYEDPDAFLLVSPTEALPDEAPLTAGHILRAMRRLTPALQDCIARALALDPNLDGRYTVVFIVTPSGEVEEVEVNGAPGNGPLESCIVEVISGVHLPPSSTDEPVRVSYPLLLEAY